MKNGYCGRLRGCKVTWVGEGCLWEYDVVDWIVILAISCLYVGPRRCLVFMYEGRCVFQIKPCGDILGGIGGYQKIDLNELTVMRFSESQSEIYRPRYTSSLQDSQHKLMLALVTVSTYRYRYWYLVNWSLHSHWTPPFGTLSDRKDNKSRSHSILKGAFKLKYNETTQLRQTETLQ